MANSVLPAANSYRLGVSERNGTKPLTIRRPKRLTVEIPASDAEKENEDNGFLIVDKVAKKSSLKKHEMRTALGNRKVQIVEPRKLRKKQSQPSAVSPTTSSSGGARPRL
jgi:hypothetical protein